MDFKAAKHALKALKIMQVYDYQFIKAHYHLTCESLGSFERDQGGEVLKLVSRNLHAETAFSFDQL